MSWLSRLLRRPSELAAAQQPGPAPSWGFGPDPWLAFHSRCVDSNGRRRESALRDLSRLPTELHGRALPLVLARMNDWVPEVRAAAVKALSRLLRDELEAAWMQSLPEVARLMAGSRWRMDGDAAKADIERFLLGTPHRRAALMAFAPGLAPSARRWLARQTWHFGALDEMLAALTQALQGLDTSLAWQALRHLQAMGPDWQDFVGVRAALAQAHFPGLRLAGLREDQARGRFPIGDEAVELAFGRHGGTRSWLLFHADAGLKQRLLEHAEAVLDAPGSTGRQLIALQLLRDLSAASLRDRIEVMLGRPVARLREMAHVLGQAVFDEADRAVLVGRALADTSPRVQAVALRAIRRGRTTLTASELTALARREPRAALPVLRALACFEPWTRALATLELLTELTTVPANAAEEMKALALALQRSLYAPTAAQSASVKQAADRLRGRHPALVFALPSRQPFWPARCHERGWGSSSRSSP